MKLGSFLPFHPGFVKINFELPHDFAVGFWTLKVVALSQVEEKKILLERWYTERYDVYVTVPPFVLDSDEYYEGDVSANFTTVNPVYGNATIRLYVRPTLVKDYDGGVQIFDRYLEEYVHQVCTLNLWDACYFNYAQTGTERKGTVYLFLPFGISLLFLFFFFGVFLTLQFFSWPYSILH